ncbi:MULTISPECIES: DUF732 domain-containing protein [unclassified Corynebacterium]|nr:MULTISPECIES: DUF732 domain-containing protein [unclassified Corynebacterium]MCS4490134.1 DUF732 domain-containing protein [Corynebacterium sp. ES2775-CONJ]MCS4492057.1 DUF732 domain-containing protein [Corynebacterium sp. ES2715-CONJ3]MCS4532165.1 DUF732 domain-containing protein [Corynebacterium sp. ES2730-CONJ]
MPCALLVALGFLAGCSSSSVTEEPTEMTVAPLTRAAQMSKTPSASARAEPSTSIDLSVPPLKNPPARSAGDQAAREVSDVPTPGLSLTEQDREFLKALELAGITVTGAENQMIGVAQVVCANNFAAATPAVAGQLIEQGRSTLAVEQITTVIEQAARQSYC